MVYTMPPLRSTLQGLAVGGLHGWLRAQLQAPSRGCTGVQAQVLLGWLLMAAFKLHPSRCTVVTINKGQPSLVPAWHARQALDTADLPTRGARGVLKK